jgi:hypothetical protein
MRREGKGRLREPINGLVVHPLEHNQDCGIAPLESFAKVEFPPTTLGVDKHAREALVGLRCPQRWRTAAGAL